MKFITKSKLGTGNYSLGIVSLVAIIAMIISNQSANPKVKNYGVQTGQAYIMTGFIGVSSCYIPEGMVGDVNNDWVINIEDVTDVANYLYINRMLDYDALARADVNGDGIVTDQDLLLIAWFGAGYLGEFPVCINNNLTQQRPYQHPNKNY